jgi:hypothetical protein
LNQAIDKFEAALQAALCFQHEFPGLLETALQAEDEESSNSRLIDKVSKSATSKLARRANKAGLTKIHPIPNPFEMPRRQHERLLRYRRESEHGQQLFRRDRFRLLDPPARPGQ